MTLEDHYPCIYVSRHGAWATCACGWSSITWATLPAAVWHWALHLGALVSALHD